MLCIKYKITNLHSHGIGKTKFQDEFNSTYLLLCRHNNILINANQAFRITRGLHLQTEQEAPQ